MKRFFRLNLLFAAACCLLFVSGCSKGDSGDAPGTDPAPDPPQEQTVTVAELKTFLAERIASCGYCRNYTVSDGRFTLNCLGNHSCIFEMEKAVLLTVGSDGCWAADGKTTGKRADEASLRNRKPEVGVTPDGNLTMNGIDLGVAAGAPLRCIVDGKKHLYFCFAEQVVALGSEMYGNYNPVLPQPGGKTLRILFIGNSFTVDATEHLPGILKAAGVANVELVRAYHGGYTLPQYNDNYALSDICARYDSPAGSGKWNGNATLDTSLERVLIDGGPYDIVTLQEHTGTSYAWEWTPLFRDALGGLMDKIQALQPNHRPTIVYLMAQVYGAYNTTILPRFDGSRERMFETLVAQVKKITTETSIDCVIPSGTALENLRTTRLNVDNGMDLTRDSYHMDYGISRYAAACAVFETVVKPCTGKTLDGNTYRYDKSDTASPNFSTPVTDDNAPIAIRAAVEASSAPFVVTDLSDL